MRIGIISDTHGHVELTEPAVDVFRNESIEKLIHCGDIGSAAVVEMLSEWETHYVFGNTDYDRQTLADAIEENNGVCHDVFGEVNWSDRKIAFLHGDDSFRLSDTIRNGKHDLVCSGHTHQKNLSRSDATTVLNPGAVYRAAEHTVAIADLQSMDIRHIVL